MVTYTLSVINGGPLATTAVTVTDELPPEARSKKTGRGQVQYWFLFRFTGQEETITLGDKKEFNAWKWTSMKKLAEKVVSFKQPVYQALAKGFKSYLK